MSKLIAVKIGDCMTVLKDYPDDHFDSCVTDPPYGLEFMGKAWDKVEVQQFTESWGSEVYRVLKPGAHLLAFGGTRTYHRMVCALEDVGFEIRDCLMWIYGSGFPKSHDVSKAIDKTLGGEREVVGRGCAGLTAGTIANFRGTKEFDITAPATPQARQWQGWGTALKPAYEPIVLARKPLKGTVAENVLKHGTGGINVDACRIGTESIFTQGGKKGGVAYGDWAEPVNSYHQGRWPSNVLLDEEAARMLDEQSGELTSGTLKTGVYNREEGKKRGVAYGEFAGRVVDQTIEGNAGGASRFFYVAKASRSEREKGLRNMPKHEAVGKDFNGGKFTDLRMSHPQNRNPVANIHPTVKPLELMRYLVKLVTPKGGLCLDPFLGSGTTLLACRLEGFNGVGIEKEASYEPIIRERLAYIPPPLDSFNQDETPGVRT